MTRNCLNVMRKVASLTKQANPMFSHLSNQAPDPTNIPRTPAQNPQAQGQPNRNTKLLPIPTRQRVRSVANGPKFSERMYNAPTQAELTNARVAMANPKPAQPSVYENYMNKLTSLLRRRRNNNQYESADESGRALYPQEYM